MNTDSTLTNIYLSMNLEPGEYQNHLILKNLSKQNIGLCVGWNQIDHYQDINAEIIGSLYSKTGADLLIRNLYRSFEIVGLVILDDNPLGHNQMGRHGLSHLHEFLFNVHYPCLLYNRQSLEALSVYYITDQQIERKINGRITIEKYTKYNLNSLIQEIRDITSIMRQPIIYECPHNSSVTNSQHHETFGTQIVGNSLFDAWSQVLNYLFHYGTDNKTLRQFHSIHWSFNTNKTEETLEQARQIFKQDEIQNLIGLNAASLTDYTQSMIDHTNVSNIAYTYGQRLWNFRSHILETLQNDLSSRHAYATTIKHDLFDSQPPCLVYLQFLYEPIDQQLNLYVVFRSHDIFKAGIPNGYALYQFLKDYSTQLGVNIGHIEITSISAHIYLSDLYNVELFTKCLQTSYIPEIHLDPRGYCVISRIGETFLFELKDNLSHETYWHLIETGPHIFQTLLEKKLITNLEHLKYIHTQLNLD